MCFLASLWVTVGMEGVRHQGLYPCLSAQLASLLHTAKVCVRFCDLEGSASLFLSLSYSRTDTHLQTTDPCELSHFRGNPMEVQMGGVVQWFPQLVRR